MANYALTEIDFTAGRTELHEALKLTGCEVSYNSLPADAEIPFVHAHKQNEELYLFVKGSGKFYADGELVDVKEGSAMRVDPACRRCIKAGADGLAYFCIQTKQGSLEQFTMGDGVMCEEKAAF